MQRRPLSDFDTDQDQELADRFSETFEANDITERGKEIEEEER